MTLSCATRSVCRTVLTMWMVGHSPVKATRKHEWPLGATLAASCTSHRKLTTGGARVRVPVRRISTAHRPQHTSLVLTDETSRSRSMERVYPRTACDAKVVRDCRNAQEKGVSVYPYKCCFEVSVRSTDFLLVIAFFPKGVTAGITTCTAFWCCHGEEEAMRQSALLPSVPHFRCT